MDAQALLESLSDEQRRAVLALRGPVRILAGAGTGKTRTITHRIAYGLATGAYSPGRVMALTFTARAAAELRQRLQQLGSPEVSARTFHSAALAQLSYFWPSVIGGALPELIEGKARLLAQAADRLGIRVDSDVLRDVAAEIEWRKVNQLDVEEYLRAERPVPAPLRREQLLELSAAYEQLKDERRRIDFEDVLLATVGLLESEPWALSQVREQYRVFLVDEYQDVSPLQQRLLELWVGQRGELCVVGDVSQTIYSFAGASSRYLLEFGRRHQNATLLELDENYRSGPQILAMANRLMQQQPGTVRLQAAEASPNAALGALPGIHAHSNDAAEAAAVAARIIAQLAEGVPAEQIAVLFRVNAQAAAMEKALAEAGIAYQIHGSVRFFEQPVVRRAIELLRGEAKAANARPLHEAVTSVLLDLGWSAQRPEAAGAMRSKWESLQTIMDQAEASETGRSLRDFVDELLRRQSSRNAPGRHAITLSTLHAAKGLEWEAVHLVGLSEGLLPISYARTEAELAEERRLLYVGITRAKRSLQLSWSERGLQGAARSRSRFLDELGLG